MHISAYEACLERVAEELMGRRKWKQYQETLMRTQLNSDQFVASIEDNNIELKKELDKFKNGEFIEISKTTTTTTPTIATIEKEEQGETTTIDTHNLEENHRKITEKDTKQLGEEKDKEQVREIIKETEIDKSESKEEIQEHKHHIKIENVKGEKLEKEEDKKDTKEIITASQIASVCNKYSFENVSNPADITVKQFNLQKSLNKSPSTSPPPPDPIDWKPNDKCHFCVNGKLLTVNAKGELVAESGPTGSETDHIQRLDCESDSNESSSVAVTATTNGNLPLMTGAGPLTDNNRVTLNKLLTQKMDSVAAQFAAIQSMLPNFNWMNQQQPQSQPDSVTPTTSDTSAAAISPSLKESPSPSDATGEQPLDLSSKPSPNSSISGDLKSVRIKSSRATPVPSTRRTYSEEDLNNALQEIRSGRLGTRKAAVQYKIPRSTLRNKIYKLTAEAKHNNEPASAELLQLEQELEKDMSDDEEGEVESNASTPQPQDEVIITRISTPNMLKKLCLNNGESGGELGGHVDDHASPKPAHVDSSKPQLVEGIQEHNTQAQLNLDAALPILLQTLLLSDKNLRDVFSAVLLNSTNNLKDLLLGATTAANAAAAMGGNEGNSALNNGNQQQDYRSIIQMLQQQQQQQQQQQPTSYVSGRRLPKSDTPETNSSLDPNESCDDPSAILKIPSYTPVAGPSNSLGPSSSRGSPALMCHSSNSNSNRNGDSPGPMLLAAAVNAAQKLNSKNLSVTPPLLHAGVDNTTPQSLRMSDVIANSIHRTMNEQANKEGVHGGAVSLLGYAGNADRNNVGALTSAGDYKKPTISVVKNIGGTDTSRFGAAPNLLASDIVQHHHHHSAHLQHAHHHLSRQEAAALAAGKGTRPKRGKYRNYDRDSLVEAVKAVQRGEMSVHRAGSYYGVPHSTLEYKVKERHLMRPRKREPKPQPGLDGTSNSSKTNANIPAGLTGLDKLKAGNGAGINANSKLTASGMKNNGGTGVNAFPGNAANGMKLPMFDPALGHLPYASPLFWPHNQAAAFSQLHLDFTAPSATSPNEASSEILKSHIQRYQDGGGASSVGGTTTTNSSNGPSPVSSPILTGQDINRARELYESSAANGASFLDGIIRKTLDRKSNEVQTATTSSTATGGVLLDQLLMKKTPLPFTNNRNNDYNSLSPSHMGAIKRSASPLSISGTSIKRERNSPHSGLGSGEEDDETSQSGVDESYEHNNNKSGNGGLKSSNLSQRSRMGSRDSNSETDNSSLKSELHMSNHHNQNQVLSNNNNNNNNSNNNNNNGNNVVNVMDINGGLGGGGGSGSVNVKTEIPNLETGTSILQEKLSQIKAEQQECDENL